MIWTKPKYSRSAVDRSGGALSDSAVLASRYDELFEIVDNWRSSHGYPLHALTMSLRSRAAPVDQNALIAQRLKRFPSIKAKLERQPNMQLSQMQDIGGCRAVVKNIHCLHALVSKFERETFGLGSSYIHLQKGAPRMKASSIADTDRRTLSKSKTSRSRFPRTRKF